MRRAGERSSEPTGPASQRLLLLTPLGLLPTFTCTDSYCAQPTPYHEPCAAPPRAPRGKAARIPREWSPVGRASVRHPAIGRCTSRLLIGSASWPVAAAVAYKVLWIAVSATSAPQRRQHPKLVPDDVGLGVAVSSCRHIQVSPPRLVVARARRGRGPARRSCDRSGPPSCRSVGTSGGWTPHRRQGPGRSSAPGSPSIHPSPAVFDLHTLRGLALNDLPDHVGRHAARHVRGEESSAFSPDPRPPAPELRGLLDRVRLERVGTHRDPRHHGRAMSAFRPGAWAPHPHVRSPSHTAVRGHSMAERCASRVKRRPRKPVPRPAGWYLGGVGLAQADQVRGDGALRSGLPAGMLQGG
jgi:hypothetical protein